MVSAGDVLAFLQNNAGALGMAIFFLLCLLRGWVVPGYIYREDRRKLEEDRDHWREAALTSASAAEKGLVVGQTGLRVAGVARRSATRARRASSRRVD